MEIHKYFCGELIGKKVVNTLYHHFIYSYSAVTIAWLYVNKKTKGIGDECKKNIDSVGLPVFIQESITATELPSLATATSQLFNMDRSRDRSVENKLNSSAKLNFMEEKEKLKCWKTSSHLGKPVDDEDGQRTPLPTPRVHKGNKYRAAGSEIHQQDSTTASSSKIYITDGCISQQPKDVSSVKNLARHLEQKVLANYIIIISLLIYCYGFFTWARWEREQQWLLQQILSTLWLCRITSNTASPWWMNLKYSPSSHLAH